MKYDLIHAHFGLCGVIANLQKGIPVITTFHGGDMYLKQNSVFVLLICWFASVLSKGNIFVNKKIPLFYKLKKYEVIPCAVDLQNFFPINKKIAKKRMNYDLTDNIILFSGSFNRSIKNATLAFKVIKKIKKRRNIKLIELKNFSRKQVNLVINSTDLLLVTSLSETGPLIVKEAMACNIPVISTDVGDVKQIFKNVNGYYVTDYNANTIARIVDSLITKNIRTQGRDQIIKLGLDGNNVAKRVYEFYKTI